MDIFYVNRLFFFKWKFGLLFLIFTFVLALGVYHAEAQEFDSQEVAQVVPEIMNFRGLRAETKSDYRWKQVKPPTAATRSLWAGQFNGASGDALLEQVNTWVNSRTTIVDDKDDEWSPANITLVRRTGDCEDVAITKYQILKSEGFPEEYMFLVIARDLVQHLDHAFLLISYGGRNVVLDNLTNMVIPDSILKNTYYPVFAYGKTGSWVFGIKKTQP